MLVLGRKRCGKSTLLRTIVLSHLEEHKDARFHVWDLTREWSRPPGVSDRLTIYPATECSFETVCLSAIDDAPSVVVCDEIDRVCPNHAGGLVPGTAAHAIVNYGRHLQVGLLAASRREGRVSSDLPALADVVYYFRTTHQADLERIEDLCGKRWAREVADLPPYSFVRYDP